MYLPGVDRDDFLGDMHGILGMHGEVCINEIACRSGLYFLVILHESESIDELFRKLLKDIFHFPGHRLDASELRKKGLPQK